MKAIVASAISEIYQEVIIREPSRLIDLVDKDGNIAIPKGLTRKESKLGWFNGKYRGKDTRILRYIGAAGDDADTVPESKLKEMTDPYLKETRGEFTTMAYSDPTFSPSVENRNNAFFENGFTLEFELKSTLDPQNGRPLDKVQQQMVLDGYIAQYGQHLLVIEDWTQSIDIKLLEKMKASHIGCVVQGRSLTLITPPLSVLGIGALPFSLTTMSTEEVLAPIIDTSKRKLVAIKLDTKSKKFGLMDEIVYCIRKNWGLRTDSMFFGASAAEPVLTVSKAYKRLINFDGSKAVMASYLTKLLLQIQTLGDNETQEDQLAEIISKLVRDGTDIVGIKGDAKVTAIQPKVDTPMMEFWKKTYEELLISAGGSTMSQLGRTSGLNRDTATIQEITSQKFVRTPDEEMVAAFYETQLLNPLLVHLVGGMTDAEGKPNINLPVRIVIRRITKVDEAAEAAQPGEENTQITDNRVETQSAQLDAGLIKQTDVENASIGS